MVNDHHETGMAPAMVFQDPAQLSSLREVYRNAGRKVVLTSGTFDILHRGHARYLRKAREFGHVLFVGVDSDEKVRTRKGPDRPIVEEDERMEMLTHLRYVDAVIIKPHNSERWSLIKTLRPDVLVVTEETYTNEEREALQEFCGQILMLPPQATTSTTGRIRLFTIALGNKLVNILPDRLESTILSNLIEKLPGILGEVLHSVLPSLVKDAMDEANGHKPASAAKAAPARKVKVKTDAKK